MARSDDSAVPVAHHDIVAVLEAVRARAIADTLLALLELLEQAEVPGDCDRNQVIPSRRIVQISGYTYPSPLSSSSLTAKPPLRDVNMVSGVGTATAHSHGERSPYLLIPNDDDDQRRTSRTMFGAGATNPYDEIVGECGYGRWAGTLLIINSQGDGREPDQRELGDHPQSM